MERKYCIFPDNPAQVYHISFYWPVSYIKQLRCNTSKAMRIFDDLPSSLTQIFSEAVETIKAKRNSAHLLLVLGLIAFAARPITLRALAHAATTIERGDRW